MKAKRRRSSHVEGSSSVPDISAATFHLLELPTGVLHHLLHMLDPGDLLKLLQTSKTMAGRVMQHSPGRLTLKVDPTKDQVQVAAVQKLLQWAPPACLKLTVGGKEGIIQWADASNMFTSGDSPEADHMQQFPCVLEVCLQRISLPTLVPAGLAASCHNIRTVRLQHCTVKASQHHSSNSSSGGSGTREALPHTRPAQHLHTLVLEGGYAPQLQPLPPPNVRLTRSMQSAAQFADQLRCSVPNVTCLHMERMRLGEGFLTLLGPQLKELVMPDLSLLEPQYYGNGQLLHYLQQLQKLLLPDIYIRSSAQVELLLSLPNLTHLQLRSVSMLPQDYSSHACKWKYLQMHLFTSYPLCLFALAKLPLHSLTQPLTLGFEGALRIMVKLPSLHEPHSLAELQNLAQRLVRCGVKVIAPELVWTPLFGDQQVTALTIIGPAFGLQARVTLDNMTVCYAVFEGLAAVYKDSLQELTLRHCDMESDMQDAWHLALTSLSLLRVIKLQDLYESSRAQRQLHMVVPSLAAAMAQQPAGRCIEVSADCAALDPEDLESLSLSDAQQELMGLCVNAKYVDQSYILVRIEKTASGT